jgi:Uma2 family endonuclease
METDVRGSVANSIRDLSEWTPRVESAPDFPRAISLHRGRVFPKQLVEYSEGFLELPPSPTIRHQRVCARIVSPLYSFVKTGRLGTVIFGLPVGLRPGLFRTPYVMFMRPENTPQSEERFSKGDDLLVEVISEQNRAHDLETKRLEYAQAGIPEYWIVDPEEETITVLVLKPRRKSYVEHGVFAKGTRATSKILPGFSVDVTETFSRRP